MCRKGGESEENVNILSKFPLILSSFELLGITIVPLCTPQLNANCVGVIPADSEISMIAGSEETFWPVWRLERGPQAVM
jgi:hypothetical protein